MLEHTNMSFTLNIPSKSCEIITHYKIFKNEVETHKVTNRQRLSGSILQDLFAKHEQTIE